jgi:RNA polymerase sigma-70 factor (ECF subfamily)
MFAVIRAESLGATLGTERASAVDTMESGRTKTLHKPAGARTDREARWLKLMNDSIGGNTVSYRRLLEEVSPAIRAAALQACRRYAAHFSDIEDIVQDTLLAIHLKRHTWKRGEPVGPWVSTIARNKLIDSLRKRNRQAEIDIDSLPEEIPEEASGEAGSARDVGVLLAKLSQRDQAIVRIVSIEGKSMREAGVQLNISEGAARVALHRALKRLANHIRREQSEN